MGKKKLRFLAGFCESVYLSQQPKVFVNEMTFPIQVHVKVNVTPCVECHIHKKKEKFSSHTSIDTFHHSTLRAQWKYTLFIGIAISTATTSTTITAAVIKTTTVQHQLEQFTLNAFTHTQIIFTLPYSCFHCALQAFSLWISSVFIEFFHENRLDEMERKMKSIWWCVFYFFFFLFKNSTLWCRVHIPCFRSIAFQSQYKSEVCKRVSEWTSLRVYVNNVCTIKQLNCTDGWTGDGIKTFVQSQLQKSVWIV